MSRWGRYGTYLRKGLLLHEVLLLLSRLGILIEPYHFYCERSSDPVGIPRGHGLDEFEFFEAGIEDSDGLAALDPNADLRQEIRGEFTLGRRCFALKRAGTIVAASWCNTHEIDFEPCRRPLEGNEAYLYRTMTLYSWRGRNLAAYLRSRLRPALLAGGREYAYSFTDYFNRPAIRFKKKIGASVMFTGLFGKFFRLLRVNWTLASRDGTSAEGIRKAGGSRER